MVSLHQDPGFINLSLHQDPGFINLSLHQDPGLTVSLHREPVSLSHYTRIPDSLMSQKTRISQYIVESGDINISLNRDPGLRDSLSYYIQIQCNMSHYP
jgi:hypothetical protein